MMRYLKIQKNKILSHAFNKEMKSINKEFNLRHDMNRNVVKSI